MTVKISFTTGGNDAEDEMQIDAASVSRSAAKPEKLFKLTTEFAPPNVVVDKNCGKSGTFVCNSPSSSKSVILGPHNAHDNMNVTTNVSESPRKVYGTTQQLDMSCLCNLLEKTDKVGQDIDGKDIILFMGATGAGKTTTLLYVLGVSFEENENFEYTPQSWPESLEADCTKFEISSGSRSCTQLLQATRLEMDSKEIIFCDSPGFGYTEGLEFDIANGFGMIQTLHHARTVKPVLILNKSCLEDRFRSLTEILNTVIRMINPEEKRDFSLFSFVFTHCTSSDEKRIPKKLSKLRQELTSPDHPQYSVDLLSLLDAMINNTSIHVLHVDLEKQSQKLLQNALLNEAMTNPISNPKQFFQTFVSESAYSALKGSLLSTFVHIEQLIAHGGMEENDIEEQIRQLQVLSKNELFLLEKTETNKLEQLFIGHCRIQFQSILDSSYGQKALLEGSAHRLRRFLLVIHDLQFENAILQLEKETERFVCKLVEPLMMGRTLDFSGSPKNYAWNCLRLKLVANNIEGLQGFGYIKESYHRIIERLNHLVYAKLRSMQTQFAKSMSHLPRRRPELSYIVSLKQSLQETEVFKTDDFLFSSELAVVLAHLEKKQNDLTNALTLVVSELRQAIKRFEDKDCSNVPPLPKSANGQSRNFLFLTVGQQATYQHLFGNKGWDEIQEEIANFDAIFQELVKSCIQYFDRKMHILANGTDVVFTTLETEAKNLEERLNELGNVCRKARLWHDFDSSEVDKVLEQVIRHQDFIKSYIRNLNEELQKQIRVCLQARITAENFCVRLNGNKERLSSLLSELNEADQWSCWSNFVSDERTIWSKMSWLRKGFLGESEHSKLKYCMNSILVSIKTAVCRTIDHLECSLTSLPKEDLTFVNLFLARQSENIQVYIRLMKIRKDSSLRTHLLDLGMRRKMFHLQFKMVQAFSRLQELPNKLIQERQFSELRNILEVYQSASELWRQLQSFASMASSLLCLDDQSTEVIERIQELIRSCPSFQEILDKVFMEVRKVKSDVEAIAFDYSNCGYIERFTYFQRLERLAGAVVGFGQYQSFPLSIEQKDLLNIEDLTLSRLSDEIENVAERLMLLLQTFPSEKADYLRIHTCLAIFDNIETVFRTSKPNLARRVTFAKQDAEKLALVNFKCSQDQITSNLPLNADTICEQLLMWKRCSYAIANWRNFSDDCINRTLLSLTSGKASSTLLDIALRLRAIQGDDAITANQILSEHSMFEGIMNSLFDEATSGQDINYVLKGLNDLAENDKVKLMRMYEVYNTVYDTTLNDGLQHATKSSPSSELEDFLKGMKSKALASVNNFSISFRQQISELTGILFAHWSLSGNMSCILGASSSTLGENVHPKKYLKKPHAAQVIAVWLMLNAFTDDSPSFGNVLVELKTGEGKSTILGVTATILAILGLQVDCVCYSSFLSNRNYQDFQSMFHCFGVVNTIKYGTIEDFSRCQVERYWQSAESCIKGYLPDIDRNHEETHPPRILLIDEVNVFLGEEIFGKTFNPGIRLACDHLKELFHSIWKNTKTKDKLTNSPGGWQKVVNSFPKESRKLIDNELPRLVSAAQVVRKEQPLKYTFQAGKIQYKHFDGLKGYDGYDTMFRFIKEVECGTLAKEEADQKLGLSPIVGKISHAELPLEYDAIIGVSGTLRGMTLAERNILKSKYRIEKNIYIPSVYGANRLKFAGDDYKDVIISDTRADFYLDLKTEIARRRSPRTHGSGVTRAVMVFFRCKKSMLEFYQSPNMSAMKKQVQVITEVTSEKERRGMFAKATEQGVVSLMIREFGRGTDFKCFDKRMLDEGGVHVIQAFFSTDPSEEIQIRGRCARQGNDGSFSMVLNAEDLFEDLSITSDTIATMKKMRELHSTLNSIRETKLNSYVAERKSSAEKAEDIHYRTLACHKAMKDGSKTDIPKVIAFFEELNGCGETKSFKDNGLKDLKLKLRNQRMIEFSKVYESKRVEAKRDKRKKQVRELLHSDESTYYDVLGVDQNCSTRDIEQSFRKLSFLFHPDKCKDADTLEIFQKLNSIKNSLCNEKSRRLYNRKLKDREAQT